MTSRSDTSSARSDTRAHQRWLIGLGITVAFGLFGAVMAVLAYSGATRAPSRGPSRSPAAIPGLRAPAAPTPDKVDTPAKPAEAEKSEADKPGKDKDRNHPPATGEVAPRR
jgi:hypothetical protein